MSQGPNRYDPDKHDDYVSCPRSRCAARNPPPGADEFSGSCWKCDTELPREHPVTVGDEITVQVSDIHESGAGVGHTEDGFVILIDGVLPEATARVRVKSIHGSFARAALLDKNPDGATVEGNRDTEDTEDTEDESDEPALGRRDNFWG